MADLSKLSDQELAALADTLATQRTAIRIQQNAVSAEIDMRRALSSMPAESRRVLELRLDGQSAPTGQAASAGKE